MIAVKIQWNVDENGTKIDPTAIDAPFSFVGPFPSLSAAREWRDLEYLDDDVHSMIAGDFNVPWSKVYNPNHLFELV